MIAEEGCHEEGQHLGSSDREGRDEDVAVIGSGLFHDGVELGDGFRDRAVFAVSIRAFQEDDVGLREWFELFEDGGVDRAEVA